jgi:xylulokinase
VGGGVRLLQARADRAGPGREAERGNRRLTALRRPPRFRRSAPTSNPAGSGAAADGRTYLGIDIGTTNIKAQIVEADGNVLSSASIAVGIRYGADGAAEQDLEEIWAGTTTAVRRAAAGVDARRIAAVGVSSQGGALQILDRSGRCTGPVIGWQDARGEPWDREIMARMGGEWFARHAGTPRSFMSVGQILRLRDEGSLPTDFLVAWVGDVIVGRLCGRRAHDATSLSEAGLYNPAENREDDEILSLLGLRRERLPDLMPATLEAGRLLPEAARSTGLPEGIPVGPAVHDQYTAAVGCGVVRSGDTMLGAGTAWALLALAAVPRPPVSAVAIAGRHPVPGVHGQMVTMVNGGACLAWILALVNRGAADVAEVDALMQKAPPGSDGLRFRPLLSALGGAGLPPGTAGRLDGLRLDHTPAHLVRSLVEGLACELGRYLGFLTAGGDVVHRIVMCGKAAMSTVTPGIIADTTGLPVECMVRPETSAIGAAVLARAMLQPGAAIEAISDEMKPRAVRFDPGPGSREARGRFGEYLGSLAAPWK